MATAISRNLLLFLLALTFSGAVSFLNVLSPFLLPAYIVVLLACIVVCVLNDSPPANRFLPGWPYAAFLLFFFAWGTLVSLDRAAILPDVLRFVAKDLLILGAIGVAIIEKPHLARFAGLVQIAMIANLGVSVWQFINPQVLISMANTLVPGSIAFSALRPAGLWINPNVAAFALVLGILLSGWARGPLAWAGRIAGVIALLLTASRSGLYILVLCAMIYLLFRLKPWTVRPAVVPAVVAGVALLGAFALMMIDKPPQGLALNLEQGSTLGRVFDITESVATEAGSETRGDITLQALEGAVHAPWYGYGVFTFQGTSISSLGSPLPHQGAHNIYLAIWGEIGPAGLVLYLLTLFIGISIMRESALPEKEHLLLALLWLSYLIIGLVWHNQLTDLLGLLYVGLLFQIPMTATAGWPSQSARPPALQEN